jgi:hypothetical protein
MILLSGSRFRSVKGIDSGVWDSGDGANVFGVATGGGSDAAVGVGATDKLDFGHDSGPITVDSFEKKPGNGCGFRGGALCDNLAFDRAAVKVSPTGACAVYSYFGSGCVVE